MYGPPSVRRRPMKIGFDAKRCAGCPAQGVFVPVLPHGPTTPGTLLVIGDAPGGTEVRDGRPFVGPSGKLLRAMLLSLGKDPERVRYTNSVLCPIKDASPEITSHCVRNNAAREAASGVYPKVLLLGANAGTAVLGMKQGITSYRGRTYHPWGPEVSVMPTVHPSFILHGSPFDYSTMALDAMKLFGMTRTTEWSGKLRLVVVDSAEKADILFQRVPLGGLVSLDVEATGLHPRKDRLLAIGIGTAYGQFIVPERCLKEPWVARWLKTVLATYRTCGHNAQFDSWFLEETYDIRWVPTWDTMLMHYVLDERRGTHDLESLARYYFNAPEYDAGIDKRKMALVPPDRLHRYLAHDVLYCRKLVPSLAARIREEKLQSVNHFVHQVAVAVGRMERTGIRIDLAYMQELSAAYREEADRLEGEGIEVAAGFGGEVNSLNSPKQLKEVFGTKSTDKKTLSTIIDRKAPKAPLAEIVLAFRHAEKFDSSFVRGMTSRTVGDRLHANFLVHGTVTGRLSCTNPNLQAIPKAEGKPIRRGFIAEDGWVLLEADYAQMDMRVAAWVSRDEALREACLSTDFHTHVAAEAIFRIPVEEVTKDQRQIAKRVNFGVLYGQGASSLAAQIGITKIEAQRHIDSFFSTYTGWANWVEETWAKTKEIGYIESPRGRRRRFPYVPGKEEMNLKNQAINTPIQAHTSDTTLASLIKVYRSVDPNYARPVNAVHDALLIEVREDSVRDLAEQIMAIMEDNEVAQWVATPVDVEVGRSWGEMTPVDDYIHTR